MRSIIFADNELWLYSYGLPWAYPGWVGNDPETGKPSGSPFTFPNQTSNYIKQWIVGAKSQYNLTIDYIGIWYVQ
jgi:galactosylceramidase